MYVASARTVSQTTRKEKNFLEAAELRSEYGSELCAASHGGKYKVPRRSQPHPHVEFKETGWCACRCLRRKNPSSCLLTYYFLREL
jgi:hypothetical protein